MSELVTVVESLVMPARERFMAIDPSGNFEREAGFAMQVLMANDYTLGVARGKPQSVIDAVANIAAVGLSLNPAKKQAYLIPRDGRICLDISYIGLLDLALMSGSIKFGQAEIVYAKDAFVIRGIDAPPMHDRDPFSEERGEIVGAYVVVKTRDDDFLTTTMTIAEILSVRDRSEAWKRRKPGQPGGPWGTDFGEMAKKTVVKRAYKLWPKTDRLDTAIHHLNTENEEGLPAIENQSEPETRRTRTLARLDKPINQGGTGKERAAILRKAAGEAIQKFNEGDEMAAYESICWIEDGDEQEIVWAILAPHSSLRSAVKRLEKEDRARQAALDLAAAQKAADEGDPTRLNALQASIDHLKATRGEKSQSRIDRGEQR
jgi:recombination protein RecT